MTSFFGESVQIPFETYRN